jgi:hypothetical protein
MPLQTCGSTSQFPDYYAQDDRPHLLFNLASYSQLWRILSDLRDASHDKDDPEQAVADQDMCKALFIKDFTGRVQLPAKEEEVMECLVPEARPFTEKKGMVLLIKPPHLVSEGDQGIGFNTPQLGSSHESPAQVRQQWQRNPNHFCQR